MQYRKLGNTGLDLSVIGFGAAPLGGVFGPTSQDEATKSVHGAIDAGINFIDVAPFYGVTRAETVLGKALEGVPRDSYKLSTKVGRYDMDLFDFSADRVRRSLDESLERLKLDYIDLIICHDIEYVDINIVVNEALPVLFEAKKAGKVGFVGVSGLPLAIFDKVLSKVELDFILSYCHHNLQDQTLIPMLQGFADKGIGVINASPLSMGLLTEQGPPVWHPAPPSIREACAKAAAYCKSHGVSLPQMGLAFASSNPLIAATLSGVGNTKELAQNLAVLDYKTDPEVLKGVTAILAPVFGMTWQSGLAENN